MEIPCECGYVARGADDDELVADAQHHAQDAHRITLTAAVVVAMARGRRRAPVRGDVSSPSRDADDGGARR